MTELERYLTEEIAIDHADGLVSRREAIRRLGLLGVSAAAAATLLSACANDKPTAASATASSPSSPSPSASPPAPATPTAAITFAGPEGRTLQATWAAAPKPRGAVLVLHENKGLTEHFRAFP